MWESVPGLAKMSAALASTSIVVWAFTGGNVAEAMGVAIGLVGAAAYMAEFWKTRTIKMLREDIDGLAGTVRELRIENRDLREELTKERMRAQEYRLRLEQGGLLYAADMVDRFLEKPREQPKQEPPK
jgi:hypothetical protein